MRAFFRGWKRKVGSVTLVIALLLMSAWLASRDWSVRLIVAVGEPAHILTSTENGLRWTSYVNINTSGSVPYSFNVQPASRDAFGEPLTSPNMFVAWKWHWTWGAFEFGTGAMHGGPKNDVSIWAAPYWSIVVPLALLSAYLLLSKPKQPDPPTEPPSNA